MKVLVSDKFSPEGLKILQETKGITLDYQPGLTYAELLTAVTDADALIVRGGTQVTEAVLQAATRLKVVARAGIGVENMDMDVANRKGVVIMNTPFGSTTTTAEHTIAMLMALARQIPDAHRSTKAGRWEKDRFLGVDIAGKTLGVIGAGKIGRLVVERALGLRLQVIAYDPYLAEDVLRQMGAEPVSFDELLARSDFLTLHVPMSPETANIIDEDALAKVKPGCRIINCALGGLLDEAALAEAIRQGRVAGAAIDVFAKEPPGPDNPLLALDQVICTPHLRAATVDAQINVTMQAARQVVAFLQKGEIVNALNVPSISAELLAILRPYLELAERLGAFQAQLHTKGLQTITVEYAGTVTEHPTGPISMALLKGLLTPMIGPLVNYVNAPHFARERGIRVVEARSSATEGYSNMIRLTVSGSDGERSVCGALFGENDYRIVRVDDYHVEAVPQGNILVLHNDDRPGVIGFIGQVLAEAEVNIAMMNLSRRKMRGHAVSLINIDSPVPEPLLARLRDNEHILSAVQVRL
ncbi:D-3-phosphoglycerate dehydrogenase [Desulfuromonas versatilis]|uniref:D-3-phosphoglycerate dehydrogenase n=1 Tax=Desulfuromonas versatilis TaxID=2802975 RepID=A0ABM8HP95_9BACT|nr:phosphoglycerate dehydrogenase [Desulfuromonas versatilis]BCR03392.1 D-3-phosphoglycerate dehydrogenase [Desulfuromonas versatilis]